MKILSASQVKELDAYTIRHEGIASVELMERAANAFVSWFTGIFDPARKIHIFCGPGNNGGDGLAIARILTGQSYGQVNVYTFPSERTSEDFTINRQRLGKAAEQRLQESLENIPSIQPGEIVIDAIFGSGLSRPVEGIYAEVIHAVNASTAIVISVDIASGLYSDQAGSGPAIIEPDVTISFQLPKLSFLLPQNEKFTGEWKLVDIGLNQNFISEANTNHYFITRQDIAGMLKPRKKFSHKGNFGKALVMAGSYGMMGAAVLASKACLRTGVGLCVSYVPECGYEIMQTSLPENMVITDKERIFFTGVPDLSSYTAIAVGPGIGKAQETAGALKMLLEKTTTPLIIDADALNLLSENKALLQLIPQGSILTPHPKEFERLAGKAGNDYERLELLRNFSRQIRSVVVLKGAHTAIAVPEGKIFFNSTGNAGMATGGSGDVLTGIITSFLAQGYAPADAAVLGVYLHGFAGDVAALAAGEPSMIASDIIDAIGEFFKEFR